MPRAPLAAVLALSLAAVAPAADRPDVVFADFEGETYGDWTSTGTAFGTGPARGTLPNQMPVTGFRGKGLVNSFSGGDRAIGTLTSPEFEIGRKYLRFLIGGGAHAGKTCINLIVDGKVVRTTAGPNDAPGGSEELQPQAWDVADLAGKRARLGIVDNETGGWGHINIDHIVFSDQKPKLPVRELVAEKPYLRFPVKNKGPVRRVKVTAGDATVAEFTIELAEGPADWAAPLDVTAWKGKALRIEARGLPEESRALDAIVAADKPLDGPDLYREKLRPQLHFTPRRGWNNDPNGLVYADGEWHLYFQHNPYGVEWGNMHWGHAVSKDLAHWEELPLALAPRRFGDWVFSGSAVVDRDNTSGWKKGPHELLVAAYTSTGRGECIVYSTDRGRTWTEYDANPVVKHQGRDPRLLWHAPTKRWIMAIYDEQAGKQWIVFYTSPDLKAWTYRSRIENFFECPDLFELPLDGDEKNRKWVLTAANSDYLVGAFDGERFVPETQAKVKGCLGKGFYAAQTFTNVPGGRIIQVGWLQAPSPGMPFNQAMSVPLELRLVSTADGPRLAWAPVKELAALHGKQQQLGPFDLKSGPARIADVGGEVFEVRADLVPTAEASVTLRVRGVPVVYDAAKRELTVAGHRAPAPLVGGKLGLTVLIDRTVIEVFAADGRVYMPVPVVPKPADRSVALETTGGVRVEALTMTELGSIWGK